MKKCLLIFLSLIVCVSNGQTDVQKAARIDSICQVYANKNMFSGSLLVAKKGKILLHKGYGMANYSYDIPNTSSTKFKLASVSKQFTAMAIMILNQKGKLSTEDKLTKYIPDYPGGDKISIHNLLTHTSGIFEFAKLPGFFDSIMKMPHSLEQMIALTKYKALEFEPGTKYEYSNSNYILLSYIIEKASGKNYGDYIKEAIFDLLGMKNSGLYDNKDVLKNVAIGYTEGNNGLEHGKYVDMSIVSGAGALYSTVDDMFLWDQSFYNEKLLKKATLEKIVTPFKENYAYGWMVDKYADHKWIYHGGFIQGFGAIISRFPDDELCIVILMNVDNYTFRGNGVIRGIMFDQPYSLPIERKTVIVDKKIYHKLIGEYEVQPGFNLAITTNGNKIFLQYSGQDKYEIFPEEEYNYYLRSANTQLQFIKDAKDKVTSLILLENGTKTQCKKIK